MLIRWRTRNKHCKQTKNVRTHAEIKVSQLYSKSWPRCRMLAWLLVYVLLKNITLLRRRPARGKATTIRRLRADHPTRGDVLSVYLLKLASENNLRKSYIFDIILLHHKIYTMACKNYFNSACSLLHRNQNNSCFLGFHVKQRVYWYLVCMYSFSHWLCRLNVNGRKESIFSTKIHGTP